VIPRFTGFSMLTPAVEPNAGEIPEPSIQDIFYALWTNETRNAMIVADILGGHGEGRECLVLSDRIEHLDLLREALGGEAAHNAAYIFMLKGGLGKKRLAAIMDGINAVPADEHRIILATGKYLGEGFDPSARDSGQSIHSLKEPAPKGLICPVWTRCFWCSLFRGKALSPSTRAA
jgi:hypothetical protein